MLGMQLACDYENKKHQINQKGNGAIQHAVRKSKLIEPLAPCPFCGEVPKLEYDDSLAFIICPEGSTCRGSGLTQVLDVDLIEQGVAVWNTRKGGRSFPRSGDEHTELTCWLASKPPYRKY